jgi:hypothetical protein
MLMLVHIPKTGGSSVQSAIFASLGESALRILTSPDRVPDYLRDNYEADCASGCIRVLSAHCHLAKMPKGEYFTLIREPFERIYSLFSHFGRAPEIIPKIPAHVNFADFYRLMLEFETEEVVNAQCHYLGDGTFGDAWANLRHRFRGWALTNRVDDLSRLMLRELRAEIPPSFVWANASPPADHLAGQQPGTRPPSYKGAFESLPLLLQDEFMRNNSEDYRLFAAAEAVGGIGGLAWSTVQAPTPTAAKSEQ